MDIYNIDIQDFMSYNKLTQTDLASVLGISQPALSPVIRGARKVPSKWADKLIEKGYDLSKYRLVQEVSQLPSFSFRELSYLSITAQAGLLDVIGTNNERDFINELDTILVSHEFEKGNYLVVEVKGDSMDDNTNRAIKQGDKLLVKELQKYHWRNKLHYKQYLFVIVSYQGILIKEIINHDVEHGIITYHSWNESYSDANISLNEVHSLFYVKKIVERRISF